jgi:capsular exopolysaccharide synthesis family protein
MSRIFEALQRADMERGVTGQPAIPGQRSVIEQPAVEQPLSPIEEAAVPDPQQSDNSFAACIRPTPWTLSASSFPTLQERGVEVEQFRRLRTEIYKFRQNSALRTILVSSSIPGEGKTFVTANLAMSLARNSEHRTLLIDGDLRRPKMHLMLGTTNEQGLSEYLIGAAELTDIMQRASNPGDFERYGVKSVSNLTFISAGRYGNVSLESVTDSLFIDMIAKLSPHFDWIVIDSAPLLSVTTAVDLARAADGVLLVARPGKTPFAAAQRAQAAFGNSRILGYVLNAVKEASRMHTGHTNYFGAPDIGAVPQKPQKQVPER